MLIREFEDLLDEPFLRSNLEKLGAIRLPPIQKKEGYLDSFIKYQWGKMKIHFYDLSRPNIPTHIHLRGLGMIKRLQDICYISDLLNLHGMIFGYTPTVDFDD